MFRHFDYLTSTPLSAAQCSASLNTTLRSGHRPRHFGYAHFDTRCVEQRNTSLRSVRRLWTVEVGSRLCDMDAHPGGSRSIGIGDSFPGKIKERPAFCLDFVMLSTQAGQAKLWPIPPVRLSRFR